MDERPTEIGRNEDDLTAVVSIVDRFEAAWQQGKVPTIAEFLPEPGSPERRKVLAALVEIDLEYRLAAVRDERLAAYLEAYPELEVASDNGRSIAPERATRNGVEETRDEVPATRASWAEGTREFPTHTRVDSQAGGDPAPETPPAEPGERYSLVRLHAEGGIGQVWAAHDHDLDRDVALKRLRPRNIVSPGARARFLREARITGRLQHPGIVPVYELCRPGPGLDAFYTMRFVNGRTLTEAVRDYHRDRKEGRAGTLELHDLLGSFLSVCQTIAYAHSRGVIHRDIKGQNVVLGDFGEVMVVDWGLAKIVGEPESAPPAGEDAAGEDATTEPGSIDAPPMGAGDCTADGDIMGTPSHMAPEQAEGRINRIDARTDVYGLGAILYEILTGEPPFRGELVEILRRVVLEPPAPPQRHVPGLSRELEGICLKCLAKAPEDRYATAADLADDVRRYLADEPVAAVPERRTTRIRRWIGRHRTTASAAAAALLVATVTLGVTAVILKQANQREAGARSKAEENWLLAREAVNRFFTRVSEEPRLKASGLDTLRKDLLSEARDYFERLTRDRGSEPRAEAERGWSDIRLARIDEELGEPTEAAAAAREARLLFEDLTRRFPRVAAHREGLAESLESLGGSDEGRFEPEAAATHFGGAIAIWDELAGDYPSEGRYRYRAATARNRLGRLLCIRLRRTQDGMALLQEALGICDDLARSDPANPEVRLARSESLLMIGYALSPVDLKAADERFRKALDIREALAAEYQQTPSYEAALVESCMFIASAYSNARTLDRARTIGERARQISERLASIHPDLPLFVENHALIETLASVSRALGGDHAGATEAAARAAARAPRSAIVANYATCCFAIAADSARRDPRLSPDEKECLAGCYLEAAMGYLRTARDMGLFRQPYFLQGLKDDPDLKTLRTWPAFLRFLGELGVSPPAP